MLPVDMVVADAFDAEANKQTLPLGDAGWLARAGYGPETVKTFGAEIAKAGTVVWNGPMGVFEFPRFAEGTFAVAKAVAESSAVSIIGAAIPVAAINQSGLSDKITHLHGRRRLPGNAGGSRTPRRSAYFG